MIGKKKPKSPARPEPVAAQWRNRIVGEAEVSPNKLLANPRNWRLHPEQQQAALAGVLTRREYFREYMRKRRLK